jgi:glycosyltransferase involved in cell wall biosynthesis
MKVSVITAVRNGAASIAPTVLSVAEQRFAAIEHVVIDGASTDGTLELVRRHKSTNGALISERDTGVYDAFNKGLAAATGDLVGFLNAGDRYVDEYTIERLATAIEKSGADAVFADVAFVDPETRAVLRRFRSTAFCTARIAYGYMPAHPTLFVRRAVFERFGKFDPSYEIAGDFEFVCRAFGRGGISYVYLPETLVYMEPGGLSNRGWKSKWTITKEVRRACKANGISSGWLRLMSRLPAKYLSDVLPIKWRRLGAP